jgi:hypothetical protein
MLFTVTNAFECVPAGIYKGEFVSVEETTTSKGKAWRWKFKITDAKASGKIVCELSDGERPASPANKTGRFLAALIGKPVADGDSVNPDDYIGKAYMLVIEPKPNAKPGETRLTTFSAI